MWIGICVVLILIIAVLSYRLVHMKREMKETIMVLDEIKAGNLDRKMVTKESSELAEICFRINEIAKNYKGQIESLEQSEKTYRQLITSLSHDIRTPLASLLGYLSAIEDNVVEGEEREEFFSLSKQKAEILKHYVDTLFEWLKLESGEQIYHFEQMDVCELLRENIAEWISLLETKGIELEVQIPDQEIELTLDFNSMNRVFNNLIQNSIIHSKTTKMELGLLLTEEHISICVRDYGIGIAENELPHIFERLYKCDAARSETGNGLGLAITMELVKANHGRIYASSEVGKGTCFVIEFNHTPVAHEK